MRESKRHVGLFHQVLAHLVTVFLSLAYRTSHSLHPGHLTPSKQSALHLCRAQAHLSAGSTDEAGRVINEAINSAGFVLWLTLRCRVQDLKEHVVVSGMVGWIDSRKWPTKHSLDLDQKLILYIEMEPTLSCPPIECIGIVPTVPPASINRPSMPHPMALVQPGPSLLLSKPT